MFKISEKSKFQIIKVGILVSLFLALFFLGFYLVNIFDFRQFSKERSDQDLIENAKIIEELQKRTSEDGINFADFKAWADSNKLSGINTYDADSDNDGLLNNQEYVYGTDPNKADTDGDTYSDNQEVLNGYDPDAPGQDRPVVSVIIEKMGVNAPMIWSASEDEKNTLKDLELGLSHFPSSTPPGKYGNAIISGHSSNYAWAKGGYNYVFKNLNDLEIGDIVIIKEVQKNGKVIFFKYRITEKFVTVADDERIFETNYNRKDLTLTTCWPLGTNLKRLIVKAELIKS